MNITEFLGQQHKGALVTLGSFLFAGALSADYLTAPEFESSMFYAIPVAQFSCFIGWRAGLGAAVISALATLSVHYFEAVPYRHPTVLYWNALVWFALYTFIVFMVAELTHLYERERQSARTDPVTQIPNRKAFLEALTREKSRALRNGSPLTLNYFELDRFKEVNDEMGHATGDNLLRIVAKVMRDNVRQADVIARLGGDEFAVLLPETDADSAGHALRKLHNLLNDAMRQNNWPVTFSMGSVSFKSPRFSVEEMIKEADKGHVLRKNERPESDCCLPTPLLDQCRSQRISAEKMLKLRLGTGRQRANRLVRTGKNPCHHRAVLRTVSRNRGGQRRSCYRPEARDRGARRALRSDKLAALSARSFREPSSDLRGTSNLLVRKKSACRNGATNVQSSSSGCWSTSRSLPYSSTSAILSIQII